MNEQTPSEGIRFGTHLYGYMLTIAIAGFGLFMVVIEPNILQQFRFWISSATLNDLMLSWFAVSVITALYLFFASVLISLLRKGTNISFFFWYFSILVASLFFSTIFYDLVVGPKTTVFVAGFAILIASNLITFFTTGVFFYLHFNDRHNFLPFVIGIMGITTAFTWFYLNFISKISVL
ncbi:MAG: hypothetical protein JXR87_00630 [Candidatus Marinimicrobia bacterium]|nr:hypothetical protein [Candidatus Neomarinimicrobiota bacterium]